MTKKMTRKERLEEIVGTAQWRAKTLIKLDLRNDGYASKDGYTADGYSQHKNQLNIKLTDEDMSAINEINKDVFDNEITNSTLARILVRRGIKTFKNLK